MDIKHISEEDFKEIIITVDDELYHIANSIHKHIPKMKYEVNEFPIMCSSDGQKLFISKSFPREVGEKDTHRFKITIEKIPYE